MKLPKNLDPKWILIALAVVVVLVVVYFFWSKTEKAQKTKESNKAVEQANKEIDPSQLNITNEQADALAEKIYNAIKGPGTDFEAIKDAIKYCKTRSDVIKVAAVYAQKSEKWWFSSGSMWTDLQEDLSTSQAKEINEIFEYKNVEFRI